MLWATHPLDEWIPLGACLWFTLLQVSEQGGIRFNHHPKCNPRQGWYSSAASTSEVFAARISYPSPSVAVVYATQGEKLTSTGRLSCRIRRYIQATRGARHRASFTGVPGKSRGLVRSRSLASPLPGNQFVSSSGQMDTSQSHRTARFQAKPTRKGSGERRAVTVTVSVEGEAELCPSQVGK